MMIEEVRIQLPQHLRDLVRRRQVHRHEFFLERKRGGMPVDRASGGSVDHPPRAAQLRVLENEQRTQSVGMEIPLGVVDGILGGKKRRKVVYNVRLESEDPFQGNLI